MLVTFCQTAPCHISEVSNIHRPQYHIILNDPSIPLHCPVPCVPTLHGTNLQQNRITNLCIMTSIYTTWRRSVAVIRFNTFPFGNVQPHLISTYNITQVQQNRSYTLSIHLKIPNFISWKKFRLSAVLCLLYRDVALCCVTGLSCASYISQKIAAPYRIICHVPLGAIILYFVFQETQIEFQVKTERIKNTPFICVCFSQLHT